MPDPMPEPTEWSLRTGPRGLLLRVREWRPESPVPARPPVVILHGFLEQAGAWDVVAAPLARALQRRVVALDQRGHGRSGHVGAGGFYHFWDYVGDLDALVEHLGGSIDLVGHSMGGTVSCLYSGTRPECVRRLVLVEGLGPPDLTASAVDRARRFLADLRRGTRHKPLEGVADAVNRIQTYNPNIPDPVAATLAERATRREGDKWTWTWDPLHRARMPVPFQASLFVEFLRLITAPTLAIDGGASSFRVDDAAERLRCIPHHTSAVIEGAGHLVHHDAPERLTDMIVDHLQ